MNLWMHLEWEGKNDGALNEIVMLEKFYFAMFFKCWNFFIFQPTWKKHQILHILKQAAWTKTYT